MHSLKPYIYVDCFVNSMYLEFHPPFFLHVDPNILHRVTCLVLECVLSPNVYSQQG